MHARVAPVAVVDLAEFVRPAARCPADAFKVERVYPISQASLPAPLIGSMRLSTSLATLFIALGGAVASPTPEFELLAGRNSPAIQYLGSQSATLSGGTKAGDLVFVSGQVPLLNGTVVPGGIKNETAFVIERVGSILKEGGTDWSKVLKVTVLLQGGSAVSGWLIKDIRDLAEMNEVYAEMIPNPKPARAAFQVGNLPVL
jgi:2-iminobutanoate/2-iminopropanoate deaminase